MKFKPKTRGGYEYRIYATDGDGHYPIHGAYNCGDGWISADWTNTGRWDEWDRSNENPKDLVPYVNVPERIDETFVFECETLVHGLSGQAHRRLSEMVDKKIRVRIEVVE